MAAAHSGGEPVEKLGIGEEPAALVIEQVADDGAACFLIGLGTNEQGAPVDPVHPRYRAQCFGLSSRHPGPARGSLNHPFVKPI